MSVYVKTGTSSSSCVEASIALSQYRHLTFTKNPNKIGSRVWTNTIQSHKEFTMTPGQYLIIGRVTVANFSTNTNCLIRLVSAANQTDSGVISECSYSTFPGISGYYCSGQIVEFMNVTSNKTFNYYPQIYSTKSGCTFDVISAFVDILKF